MKSNVLRASTLPGFGLLLVAALFCQHAAVAGPLDDFAKNNSGTAVQVGIAQAIQSICPQLVASFGGMSNALAAPASANKDITLRCNELISTAAGFANPSTRPARSLNYSSPQELLASLQQVTGEESSAKGTLSVRAANSQFSAVAARLGALRMAATGAGSTAPATAFNIDLDAIRPLGGGASADGENADGSPELKRGGFFINGNFNSGDREASDLEDGFKFDTTGITAGFDHRFDKGVMGVSVGYDKYSSDFRSSAVVSGGAVDAKGLSVSLFGMKEFGNFFIDGVLNFGQLSYDVDRVLRYTSANTDPNCQCPNQDRRLTGDPDSTHTGLSFTAGGQIFAGAWLIQPSFVASFRKYKIDGYTERDNLPSGGMELRFGDQTIDSVQFHHCVSVFP